MLRTFKKIPYKLDIFIVTTILIISIIERVHIDLTFYRAGLTNSHTYAFIPLIFLYELLKIAVVLFAVIRISFYLMPEKKHKKYIITALLSIAIFIGYWILLITFFEPGAVYFLKGFEKWISKNVDIVAIQTWFLSVL